MKLEWRLSDGYHQEWKLIDRTTGRIIGTVYGSTYQQEEGFTAHDETALPSKHLGRYINPEFAKAAVLASVKAKGKTKRRPS